MKKSALLALVAVLLLAVAACGGAGDKDATGDPHVLRVALLPDENANTVIQKNEPLQRYLEDRLDKQIEFVVTTDYSSMIEAMRRGRLELAYFGPVSYVLAKQRSDIEAFAGLVEDPGGAPEYHAIVIGNAEQGISAISDLRGRTVAYGDPASTSSHMIPKSMLAEQGLRADADYSEQYVGAHDAVALAVQNGNASGGGLSKPIFERLVEQGVIDPSRVRVIGESAPYPNYPWTMRSDLDPQLKEAVRDAFLTLDAPEVLEPFEAAGFAPVSDADYDVVRRLGTDLGIDLGGFAG